MYTITQNKDSVNKFITEKVTQSANDSFRCLFTMCTHAAFQDNQHDACSFTKKLAEAIEIDPVTLNRYITGERRIPEPTLHKVADFFHVEPQQLFGTDDPDVLIWHYHRLEGAEIDIDEGLQQALVQGREKTFVYPILRKYYTKDEMQELVDSYDSAGGTEKEVWPGDTAVAQKGSKAEKREPQNQPCHSIPINLAPPESLFDGASTEEKKELLEIYFSKLKEIVELTIR